MLTKLRQQLQNQLTKENLIEGGKFFALLNLGLFATAVGIALFT